MSAVASRAVVADFAHRNWDQVSVKPRCRFAECEEIKACLLGRDSEMSQLQMVGIARVCQHGA
jgi:hypothetical protein